MKKVLVLMLMVSSLSYAGRKMTWGATILQGTAGSPFGGYMSKTYMPSAWQDVIYNGYLTFGSDRKGGYAAWFNAYTSIPQPSYRNVVGYGIGPATVPVWCNVWFYIPNTSWRPATTNTAIATIVNSIGTKHIKVLWRTDGKWSVAINDVIQATSADTVRRDVWQIMRIYSTWGTTNVTTRVIFNGQTLTTTAAIEAASSTSPNAVYIGVGDVPGNDFSHTLNIYADDLLFNDSSLTVENAEPDTTAHVIMRLVASDNNRGGWVRGDDGTTNLSGAINQNPPRGNTVETATTNIKNTNSSTTDTAKFNVAAYNSNADLPAGMTIKVIVPFVRHSEHTGANTKNGRICLISNPSDGGGVPFVFGADAGAHANDDDLDACSGTNGCADKHWVTSFGTTIYNPTVVLGTQPVIGIVRETASTDQVDADLAGLLLQYQGMGVAQKRGKIINAKP